MSRAVRGAEIPAAAAAAADSRPGRKKKTFLCSVLSENSPTVFAGHIRLCDYAQRLVNALEQFHTIADI